MALKLTKFKTLQDEVLKLRNQNADLNKALEDIIKSWDDGMQGEVEQYKESSFNVYPKYWSPLRSLVESEVIAAARKVLKSK